MNKEPIEVTTQTLFHARDVSFLNFPFSFPLDNSFQCQ